MFTSILLSHDFSDIPADGVPPRSVVQKMFPTKDLSNACATTISLADYTSWVDETRQNYETRQTNVGNLNSTTGTNSANGGSGRRKKRSPFVKSNKFCASLIQDNGWTYGINPKQQGNSLDAAIICDCRTPPWKRVRKQIKYKYCYSDNINHPKNDEFKKLKKEVETHVSVHLIYLSNHILVESL